MKTKLSLLRSNWISFPTTVFALSWVLWVLWGSVPDLIQSIHRIDYSWFALMLPFLMVANYLIFEVFYIVFRERCSDTYSRWHLASFYFSGQLLRHLPGRVLGVAYQIAVGDKAKISDWIFVNLLISVLSIFFSVLMCFSAISFFYSFPVGVVIIVFGFVAFKAGWLMQNKLLKVCELLPDFVFCKIKSLFDGVEGAERRLVLPVFLIFSLSWFFYFLAWFIFGFAWPSLDAKDGVLLCVFYTMAWFVGYLSLITPSGLGVRELVFIFLAKDFPPDAVAALTVIARILLLLVDVVLGFLFLLLGFLNERKNKISTV